MIYFIMKIINQVSTRIEISDQQTTYIVGYDLLDNLSDLKCFKGQNAENFMLLTDNNLFKLYGKRVIVSLKKTGRGVLIAVVPAGEKSKSLATVESVCKTFLENKASRKSILLTLGGGVITDLGGFIGSILLRGIQVIHLPTTLLAQIDAAIGGKSAVDVNVNGKMLKNMIGKIEQPFAVISDVSLLSTLPKKEVINGLGEMIKYWAGWGKPSKDLISSASWRIKNQNNTTLAEIVSECQRIKLDMIRRDPFDTLGIREKLNLGHTIGHAIEGEMNGQLSHGESVALGLVAASKISVRTGMLSIDKAEVIIKTVKALGLPVILKGADKEKIMDLIAFDKKNGAFVLMKDIGTLVSRCIVDKKIIREAISEVII